MLRCRARAIKLTALLFLLVCAGSAERTVVLGNIQHYYRAPTLLDLPSRRSLAIARPYARVKKKVVRPPGCAHTPYHTAVVTVSVPEKRAIRARPRTQLETAVLHGSLGDNTSIPTGFLSLWCCRNEIGTPEKPSTLTKKSFLYFPLLPLPISKIRAM